MTHYDAEIDGALQQSAAWAYDILCGTGCQAVTTVVRVGGVVYRLRLSVERLNETHLDKNAPAPQ